MGIYIKDMDIPKDEAIALYIYPDGRAKLWRPQAAISHEYEAVSVPSHGRCIDADVLTYLMGMDEHFTPLEALYLMGLIADSPTIIPAEEEK